MDVSSQWFEELCRTLSRDPSLATAAIQQLVDSDGAVDASCRLLQSDLSLTALFHAASVLQRSAVLKWDLMGKEKQLYVKSTAVSALKQQLLRVPPVVFVVNKLMQTVVSVWKRDWLESTDVEKQAFFGIVSDLMINMDYAPFAIQLLRVTLEEFEHRSYSETQLQIGLHARTKLCFETDGLPQVVSLSMQPLSFVLSLMKGTGTGGCSLEVDSDLWLRVPLLIELCKLLVAVMNWRSSVDCESTASSAAGEEHRHPLSGGVIKLPRQLGCSSLIQPDFICSVVDSWRVLVAQSGPLQHRIGPDLYQNCSSELSQLILVMASVDGEVFSDSREKAIFGNHFLESLLLSVSPSLRRSCPYDLQVTDNDSYDYASGGSRQQVLELFTATVVRLVGNYTLPTMATMPAFESLVMCMSGLSLELLGEMRALSQLLVGEFEHYEQHLLGTGLSSSSGVFSAFPRMAALPLLQTWRADVLSTVLDIWRLIYEDATLIGAVTAGMASSPAAASRGDSALTSSEEFIFFRWLTPTSTEIFEQSVGVIVNVMVYETLSEAEQGEDEDLAGIQARDVDGLLSGICIIGRAAMSSALQHLYGVLEEHWKGVSTLSESALTSTTSIQSAMSMLARPLQCIQALRCLEKMRVCVELFCYLLFENFHSSADQQATANDDSLLSAYALHFVQVEPQAIEKLLAVGQLMSAVLFTQSDFIYRCSSAYPLVSPLLMQSVFLFFERFVLTYMDPEQEQFNGPPGQRTAATAAAEGASPLHRLYGHEFDDLLDRLLSCSAVVVRHLPLESELIASIARSLGALSWIRNGARLLRIAQHKSLQYCADDIGGRQLDSVDGDDRSLNLLGVEGLSSLHEAVCSIYSKAGLDAQLNQMCMNVYSRLQMPPQLSGGQAAKRQVLRVVSALSGLAKCPSRGTAKGSERIVHTMLEASWPALRERIASFCHCDEVVKQFLALLLNVSEFQLLKLSNAHCMEVYRTAFELVQLLRDRFKGSCADDSRGSAEQESSFRCEVCMQLLDVFNLLSTKDFQFFDDDQDSSYQSFDQEIATILLFGLEMLLPVLNKDFLSSFPRVGEKFFCFVSFLTGSYVVRVASWANSGRNESIVSCSQSPSASARGNHRSLFHDLLDRLLWATRAVDAATAKSAFQSLQAIGTHQWRCVFNRTAMQDRVPFQEHLLLLGALDDLLQSLFPAIDGTTTNGSYKDLRLSWDRIDGLANAIMILVSIDPEHCSRSVETLISKHFERTHGNLRSSVGQLFRLLLTDRQLDLSSIDRSNRMLFVLNFREFLIQWKSLGFV